MHYGFCITALCFCNLGFTVLPNEPIRFHSGCIQHSFHSNKVVTELQHAPRFKTSELYHISSNLVNIIDRAITITRVDYT